jgi:two-component sensor histidine kinase
MNEQSAPSGEEALLRRRIRDVVALSTLPAIWGNADARQIAERTAEVLLGMLPIEVAAVVLSDDPPTEIIRHRAGGLADWEVWLRNLLAARPMPRGVKEVFEGVGPDGSALRVSCVSMGLGKEGTLITAAATPDYPAETERLLLDVSANQAALALRRWHSEEAAQAELAERRRVEKHQELLLAELNHRVKNTLAIVLSIATQTLRHTDTAEAFRVGFESRIMALAEAHNLLTDHNWEGASLRAMVESVLNPYRGEGEPRYTLSAAPDIQVGPKLAVALVMSFNELATNAAKYGALSNEKGLVNVSWSLPAPKEPKYLRVKWEETGGPQVKKPSHQGFGSRLIRALSEDEAGKVEMEFAPSGLVCTFDVPLPAGTAL